MPDRGRCFSTGWATLSGPVAVDEEKLEAAARTAEGKRGAKGRVRHLRVRDSAELRKIASGSATQGLWLGDKKSGISGNRRRPKLTPWKRNSWKS